MVIIRRNILLILIGIIVMSTVYFIDRYTSTRIPEGLLYVTLLFLTLFVREENYVIPTGITVTAVVIIGFYISTHRGAVITTLAISNLLLSIVGTWVIVILIYTYKRSAKSASFYSKQLSAIFKYVEEGIIIVGEDEKIISANAKISRFFGFSEEELIGQKFNYVLPAFMKTEDGEVHEKIDLKTPASFSGKKLGFQATKKNGYIFPATVHIWGFDFANKKYFVFFIIDITEKLEQKKVLKQANAQLFKYSMELKEKNSELGERMEDRTKELRITLEELKSVNSLLQKEITKKEGAVLALKKNKRIMENIALNFPNGIICVLDTNFLYLYVQGQDLKKTGLTQEELIGKKFLLLNNERAHDEIKENLSKALQGEKASFEYKTPDNSNHYLITATPLLNSNDEASQILVVTQNITVLKNAEYEIQKSLEREKKLNELKSRFVSMASHEFRTPLGVIISSTSLISMYNKPGDEAKRYKHIERINTSVTNLTEILNDFLSLGKIEEGKVFNQPVEFDIVDFCQEIKEELGVLTKPNQEIKLTYRMNNSIVYMDKQLLRNILINLLSNAIKYSSIKTVIFLDAVKQNDELIISVKDQGIGVPLEDQKHLFETFFRASNVENIKGTGMGLHIIKKHVEIMKGNIEFESRLNRGSCFTVKFPLMEETCPLGSDKLDSVEMLDMVGLN